MMASLKKKQMVIIMNKYKTPSLYSRLKQSFLLFVAIAGIIWSIMFSFATGSDIANPNNKLSDPAISSFEHTIAGIGIIESSSRNINIGSFAPGIVSEVLVTEGQIVNKDDILFILDQTSALAEIESKINAIKTSKSQLELKLVELADSQDRFDRAKGLKSGRSISKEDLQSRHFAVEKAKANILIAENMILQSETNLKSAKITLDKTIIKSPIDAIILKVRVNPGEFISGNEQTIESPILLGKTKPLYVRVQIDENDIWRFDSKLLAFGYLRGNSNIKLPLKFIRVEPYAKSKENIKGTGTELVDTRIIEIIYEIDPKSNKIYIGQQIDVFLESSKSP